MAARWSSTGPFPQAMVALMGVAGTTHFTSPGFYDPLVPAWMPGSARTWTYVSGVAELACAGLMARRSTRRLGGAATIATLVAVWTANWQAALDGGMKSQAPPFDSAAAAWIRLPLQLPMLWGAWRVARR
jgi:uncharacterized membrane protein